MDSLQYGGKLLTTGHQFNDWTALAFFRHPQTGVAMLVAQCKCGRICLKEVQQLSGTRGSRKCSECPRYRGGVGATPEYKAWRAARSRCHNPKDRAYKDYGARGIRMCEQWRESFTAFMADVGQRPSKNHSLDRIENDGNYEPGNVRWATRTQQARNRRSTVEIEYGGQALCIGEWERMLGFSHHGISSRLKRGWTVEQALSTPASAERDN